jgi:hypothetical protein
MGKYIGIPNEIVTLPSGRSIWQNKLIQGKGPSINLCKFRLFLRKYFVDSSQIEFGSAYINHRRYDFSENENDSYTFTEEKLSNLIEEISNPFCEDVIITFWKLFDQETVRFYLTFNSKMGIFLTIKYPIRKWLSVGIFEFPSNFLVNFEANFERIFYPNWEGSLFFESANSILNFNNSNNSGVIQTNSNNSPINQN